MKIALAGLVALVVAGWGIDIAVPSYPLSVSMPWMVRQEAMYLSGLLSVAMMSFAMLLATRPAWMETPLGGLDRMYRTHKWAGILGVGFGALHWLIEMSDDILKALVGRAGRVPKLDESSILGSLRDFAEGMGEWAIYTLLVMLAVTLWKVVPYRPWRLLHRAMPIIYLLAAVHAALLAPTDYWIQPVGILLGLMMIAGIYGSLIALTRRIGRSRTFAGTIVDIEYPTRDVVRVRCLLDEQGFRHRPGQFAFVTFDRNEGAHPYTIASANRGDRTLTFEIKALGDYTGRLKHRLSVGRPVHIEGPYGRFDLGRTDRKARQVWVAGGIGVTPFLAWMEALPGHPHPTDADLHYWTSDPATDPYVERLRSLAANLPGIRVHTHAGQSGDLLSGMVATTSTAHRERTEFWFCGPRGLAKQLQEQLANLKKSRFRFHQEAFELR